MKKLLLLLTLSVFSNSVAFGQETVPYAWLAGTWTGDGFGGTSEEMWSEPSADGTMMGTYRHHKGDGSLNFYEFMVMDSTGLRLKHFNPDMMAWETKEDFVHFKLIEFAENKIVLKGLVFELKSDTELEIRLDLKDGDKKWTEVFKMTRK
ncbi:DUF6265 family protein [Ekhidna sp. To15]|uniref:DUF6265 family protein n=1 Tax=Ekhidna sp. To15 TaxID=3395267 RepID=UPI003F52666F